MKVPPVFDVGYLDAAAEAADGPERFAAPAYREVELILRVEERGEGLAMQLLSRRDRPAPGLAELGEALLAILGAAARQPDVPLGDIPLAAPAHPAKLPGRPLAALQFNF
jgi:hypothetical protein